MSNKIFLKDYKKPSFKITHTDLFFNIFDDYATVTATLKIHNTSNVLVFDGDSSLELLSVKVNNKLYSDYKVQGDKFFLECSAMDFTLETIVKINPFINFSGEGLYRSGNILCTQCEAQGFRKITYYLDRPDNMSIFQTTIEASKNDYPHLLSNGNLLIEQDLGARHRVLWGDPFAKPSYLFALVAGDFDRVSDSFMTKSQRKVSIEFYVDKGNASKCDHAISSLKKAMKWDEQRFNLEYDLDLYMVVAVDSFNMGAMENKGLNIFNSAYVLADKESATDTDYKNIEGVIGHEYFHNWSGNRVTCRDWFQLTLKEGLTVFRDQEFSADMLSRSVKRIEDVMAIKRHQFMEDAGPLRHPIRPQSYEQINNFYTATVYDKGAEVIRMIHTLLGEEGFKKGLSLYFDRYDAKAVTCDDFITSMQEASGHDLSHFKAWYDQVGTPHLKIDKKIKDSGVEVTIFQQDNTQTSDFDCLYFPLAIAVLDDKIVEKSVLISQKETKIFFEGISGNAVLSINRGFSVPAIIDYHQSDIELVKILKYETDGYARYESVQSLYMQCFDDFLANKADTARMLYPVLMDFIENECDYPLCAFILNLPSDLQFNERLTYYDPELVEKFVLQFKQAFVASYHERIKRKLSELEMNVNDLYNEQSLGLRSIINQLYSWLAVDKLFHDIIKLRYDQCSLMEDKLACFSALIANGYVQAKGLIQSFYDNWSHNDLVIQKWISRQAALIGDIEQLKHIESKSVYNNKVPNYVRSLYGGFSQNLKALHALDGSGYQFFVNGIFAIDQYNPQLAARLLKNIGRVTKLDSIRQENLMNLFNELSKKKKSNDLSEVFDLIFKDLKA